MQTLRHAHLIARFVLVWFALSIGVAIASPLVKPQDMQFVCSAAGSLKLMASSDGGKVDGQGSGHTLDCPLCAGLGAPPPVAVPSFTAAPPLAFALVAHETGSFTPVLATPPPARGPPSRA
jgi:Protein of unknown function (DUF2946)